MLLFLAPVLALLTLTPPAQSLPQSAQRPLFAPSPWVSNRTRDSSIPLSLFHSIDEHARLADIAYCLPLIGIAYPFHCPSRCSDFPNFELISNFGPIPIPILDQSASGYLAYDHTLDRPRIIVSFRGTYSLVDTLTDLATAHQSFVPFQSDEAGKPVNGTPDSKCDGCTVHNGFLTSYHATRPQVIKHLGDALLNHPNYQLTVVGHSMGGSMALLFALEMRARGMNLSVSTFGQPATGNLQFAQHVEARLAGNGPDGSLMYRRVTHKGDIVPALPFVSWGFSQTAGELYIRKDDLPQTIEDVTYCPERNGSGCYESQRISRGWSPWRFLPRDYITSHRQYLHLLGLCSAGNEAAPLAARHGRDSLLFGNHDI